MKNADLHNYKANTKLLEASEITPKPASKIVINISPEVWEYLKSKAEAFSTPDATLRKLFGLPEKKKKVRS